jgi:hypothetical protein
MANNKVAYGLAKKYGIDADNADTSLGVHTV